MSSESRRLDTLQSLRAATAVGVVRDSDGPRAERIARALLQGGLRAVEITTTTPGAMSTLARLAVDHPDARFGLGTVRTEEHLDAAANANVHFAVSPHTDPDLIRATISRGLVAIPGALTPTEIVAAADAGADFVKVFPISAMGGPSYLRDLRGPLPHISYWVSGRVTLADVPDFLDAGAELIGLRSALTADLPNDEFDEIVRQRAEAAVAAVTQALDDTPALTLIADGRTVELGLPAIRSLPASEHTPLDALVPGRRGQAVRLRRLLESAGIAIDAQVVVRSRDGFARHVSARALYDGGLLHFATDGHPIGTNQGGPLRLYIAQGPDQCDNLKGLARIETVPTP